MLILRKRQNCLKLRLIFFLEKENEKETNLEEFNKQEKCQFKLKFTQRWRQNSKHHFSHENKFFCIMCVFL